MKKSEQRQILVQIIKLIEEKIKEINLTKASIEPNSERFLRELKESFFLVGTGKTILTMHEASHHRKIQPADRAKLQIVLSCLQRWLDAWDKEELITKLEVHMLAVAADTIKAANERLEFLHQRLEAGKLALTELDESSEEEDEE